MIMKLLIQTKNMTMMMRRIMTVNQLWPGKPEVGETSSFEKKTNYDDDLHDYYNRKMVIMRTMTVN